jgi:hypothetical protein
MTKKTAVMDRIKARAKPAEPEEEKQEQFYEVTARDMVLVIKGHYKVWPPLTEPQSKG